MICESITVVKIVKHNSNAMVLLDSCPLCYENAGSSELISPLSRCLWIRASFFRIGHQQYYHPVSLSDGVLDALTMLSPVRTVEHTCRKYFIPLEHTLKER